MNYGETMVDDLKLQFRMHGFGRRDKRKERMKETKDPYYHEPCAGVKDREKQRKAKTLHKSRSEGTYTPFLFLDSFQLRCYLPLQIG